MEKITLLIRRVYDHFMRDSLYRNSIYLLANLVIGALSGFLYLIVITHFYSQKNVGYATALIGALGLATALSNFGMNRTIVRFLGRSNSKSQDLVTKLLLVAIGSTAVGLILSLFFRKFGIKDANTLTSLIFVLAVFCMSLKSLFDNFFIAIQKSFGTLLESSLLNVVKVVFPVLVVGAGFLGIFTAQLVGALIAVLASLVLARRAGIKWMTKPSLASLKGKWSFALGSYTSDLIGGLPASMLPIIVVAKLGPIDGALWYAAMQIVNFLLAVSSSINQAMFAEMANNYQGLFKIIRKAGFAMYGIVVPISVVIFILAPNILAVFSKSYVLATTILRLMTIFALIGIANYITGSILALYKKVAYLTLVNVVNAVVVLIYCLLVATNLNGIAVGWMFGELANVILFVGGAVVLIKKAEPLLR